VQDLYFVVGDGIEQPIAVPSSRPKKDLPDFSALKRPLVRKRVVQRVLVKRSHGGRVGVIPAPGAIE
jgi:hypothetical protein